MALQDNLINSTEAVKMIRDLDEDKCPESKSGHIEWDSFTEYMDYIKQQMSDAGKEINGFQYYFARYDDKPPYANHEWKRTIVIYPTYCDDKGNTRVYDPSTGKHVSDMIRTATTNDGSATSFAVLKSGSGGSSAYNRTQMCPPLCH